MNREAAGLERAAELASLIEVQAGAIVSRTIIKRPSGSVTLFAFDAGESLSEHTTPHDAIILGLGGEAEITIAGSAQILAKGEALHLPADVPHAVRAVSAFRMMLIMLRNAGE
jgi:quercetin dioxygenase-like cupin family protein